MFCWDSEIQIDICYRWNFFVLLCKNFDVLKHNRLCQGVDYLLRLQTICLITLRLSNKFNNYPFFIAENFFKNTSLILGYFEYSGFLLFMYSY